MPIAIARKKNRSTIYEDEMLALIFGPIEYMGNEQRAFVIKEILEECKIMEELEASEIENSTIEFWPNIASCGRNEPDVIFKMEYKGSKYAILIEVKWNSPQGKDQLKMQWKHAKENIFEHHIRHIYLTKRPHSLHEMICPSENREHASHLKNLTWASLSSALSRAEPNIGSFANWSAYARTVLKRYGAAPFTGFSQKINDQNKRYSKATWRFHKDIHHLEWALLLQKVTKVINGEVAWKFQTAS